ncbi:hypothetical protein ACLOJK_030770 [Asimina triloba]
MDGRSAKAVPFKLLCNAIAGALSSAVAGQRQRAGHFRPLRQLPEDRVDLSKEKNVATLSECCGPYVGDVTKRVSINGKTVRPCFFRSYMARRVPTKRRDFVSASVPLPLVSFGFFVYVLYFVLFSHAVAVAVILCDSLSFL